MTLAHLQPILPSISQSPFIIKDKSRNKITKEADDEKEKLQPNDVVCGRGGYARHHVGNHKFLKLVAEHQEEYLKIKKRTDKTDFSRKIVELTRNQCPPGRFVKKDPITKSWYDVGDAEARRKVSQALRENAPELREQIQKRDGDNQGEEEQSSGETKMEIDELQRPQPIDFAGDGAALNGPTSGVAEVEKVEEEQVEQGLVATQEDDVCSAIGSLSITCSSMELSAGFDLSSALSSGFDLSSATGVTCSSMDLNSATGKGSSMKSIGTSASPQSCGSISLSTREMFNVANDGDDREQQYHQTSFADEGVVEGDPLEDANPFAEDVLRLPFKDLITADFESVASVVSFDASFVGMLLEDEDFATSATDKEYPFQQQQHQHQQKVPRPYYQQDAIYTKQHKDGSEILYRQAVEKTVRRLRDRQSPASIAFSRFVRGRMGELRAEEENQTVQLLNTMLKAKETRAQTVELLQAMFGDLQKEAKRQLTGKENTSAVSAADDGRMEGTNCDERIKNKRYILPDRSNLRLQGVMTELNDVLRRKTVGGSRKVPSAANFNKMETVTEHNEDS